MLLCVSFRLRCPFFSFLFKKIHILLLKMKSRCFSRRISSIWRMSPEWKQNYLLPSCLSCPFKWRCGAPGRRFVQLPLHHTSSDLRGNSLKAPGNRGNQFEPAYAPSHTPPSSNSTALFSSPWCLTAKPEYLSRGTFMEFRGNWHSGLFRSILKPSHRYAPCIWRTAHKHRRCGKQTVWFFKFPAHRVLTQYTD